MLNALETRKKWLDATVEALEAAEKVGEIPAAGETLTTYYGGDDAPRDENITDWLGRGGDLIRETRRRADAYDLLQVECDSEGEVVPVVSGVETQIKYLRAMVENAKLFLDAASFGFEETRTGDAANIDNLAAIELTAAADILTEFEIILDTLQGGAKLAENSLTIKKQD